jgi:hypothetical protein
MIQRVQSIWLLLTTLTLICLIFFPITSNHATGEVFSIYTSSFRREFNGASGGGYSLSLFPLLLIIANVILAFLSFINIFLFKNRTLQKRMCVIIMVLLAGFNFWVLQAAQSIPGGLKDVSVSVGAFLPILAIIWCFLAFRGIRNDERLIRSADRLR